MVDLRRAADERPQPLGRVIHSQPGLGIAPRGLEFEAIADDAGSSINSSISASLICATRCTSKPYNTSR
jgi:hypothetical protein